MDSEFTYEVIAKPSGFTGTRAFCPRFSRTCGRDARAPSGFAITSAISSFVNLLRLQIRRLKITEAALLQ
jgi:hypothetical protein